MFEKRQPAPKRQPTTKRQTRHTSRLFPVAGTQNPDRKLDVIFVHGIDGDPFETWGANDESDADYWLPWLAADMPDVGVRTLRYAAHRLDWSGPSMLTADRAKNVAALLVSEPGLDKPIVFVAHSLGGIVVKAVIRSAADSPRLSEYARLLQRIRGVYFVSTPHSGSALATWLDFADRHIPGMRASDVLRELKADAPVLTHLTEWFQSNRRSLGIRVGVAIETQPTRGFLVVTRSSGNAGMEEIESTPVDGDHYTVAQPESRHSLVYLLVSRFIRACLAPRPIDNPPPADKASAAVHQTATVNGSGNTTIQAAGSNIQVTVGGATLTLVPASARAPSGHIDPNRELDLITPYRRSIPLIGRETDMDALWGWLHAPSPVSIRVLIGRAGAGKTRLAIELMERLATDAAAATAWHAGFVSGSELTRFAAQQNLASWGWQKSTLVVVDYAAELTAELRTWIEQISENAARSDGPKLRLLLLNRDASTETGWLQTLLSSGDGYSHGRVRELFDPREPVPVSPLSENEQCRAVLQATLDAGADAFGMKNVSLPRAGVDPDFDRRLTDPQWADPLYLMMAAVLGLRTGVATALALSRTGLAIDLARRELQRIGHFVPKDVPFLMPLVYRVVAFATLTGGLDDEECLAAVRSEGDVLGLQHAHGPGALVQILRRASPRADGGVAAVIPDIVGEGLILEVLGTGATAKQQAEAILRALPLNGATVPATLVRIAQDFANAETSGIGALPLVWIDRMIDAGESGVPAILRALASVMPYPTLALREQAARLSRLLLEDERTTAAASGETASPGLAIRLNNLAVQLSDLGQREEALHAAQEAADLYRTLAAQRPDAFLPDLAMSLNNLAVQLSDLGQREEALHAAQEAADLYRTLAARRPDAFLPDLAMSLNNLANRLSNLGQREEALHAAQEAADLYRLLAAQRPDAFLPDLAMSLNNLANMLSDLGQREEALHAAQEAADLYRTLAAQRPDAFLPDLAMSLNNLANMLSNLGQREEALHAAQEAVRLRRQLAAQRPDAFLPDLAMSLNNLANMLSNLGQREEALHAAQEAVRLRRQLAAQRPDAFLPDLAMSLNTLAIRLSELGQREEALHAAQEAADLYRTLAAQRPDAFLPDLAKSLAVLGLCLRSLDRHTDALACIGEGLVLIEPLCARLPAAFAGLTQAIASEYLQQATLAGAEPDGEVLVRVVNALQKAQQSPAVEE